MSARSYGVLFLCTGNAGRSIIAESVLRAHSAGKFRAYSAGSHPRVAPDPMVLQELSEHGYDVRGLRSKEWHEFAGEGSPAIDFVITVCDQAAGESCPVWPGRPITAHWGLEDPHAFTGPDEQRRWLIRRLIRELENRIKIFVALPFEQLDTLALKSHLDRLGRQDS